MPVSSDIEPIVLSQGISRSGIPSNWDFYKPKGPNQREFKRVILDTFYECTKCGHVQKGWPSYCKYCGYTKAMVVVIPPIPGQNQVVL